MKEPFCVLMLALIGAGALASCGKKETPTPADTPVKSSVQPSGSRFIDWPGNSSAIVTAIKLDDGTRCVAMMSYRGNAISCDWGRNP